MSKFYFTASGSFLGGITFCQEGEVKAANSAGAKNAARVLLQQMQDMRLYKLQVRKKGRAKGPASSAMKER